MQFEVNGKKVDFAKALPFAKPWDDWTIGEKRVLDRLGFDLTARDTTKPRLTYDDLIALVVYFGMKANRNLLPSDLDALSEADFSKIVGPFVDAFAPIIFPAKDPANEAAGQPGVGESPLAGAPGENGSGGISSISPKPPDGNPETSTG